MLGSETAPRHLLSLEGGIGSSFAKIDADNIYST